MNSQENLAAQFDRIRKEFPNDSSGELIKKMREILPYYRDKFGRRKIYKKGEIILDNYLRDLNRVLNSNND